jgi:DNA-binding phage protein
MSKTICVDDLPEFDPAQYLDNEESIAVYLTVILEANNAALLASALGDIARARHEGDRQGRRNYPRSSLQSPSPQ